MVQTYSWVPPSADTVGAALPYHSYAEDSKQAFGSRLQKLSVHAGFTCPNRDGSKGVGGCTYCDNAAFNPSYCRRVKGIKEQLEEGKRFHAWRYRKAACYAAYFQTYSNTYAPLEVLKSRYEEALSVEGIVGLIVSTRPDCLPDEVLRYLSDLSKQCYLRLEIGIESCYDKTLQHIRRGHDAACTLEAYRRAGEYGLNCGGHLMFGLPGESREEMVAEAALVSKYPALDSLKLHQLQIIKQTAMAQEYEANPERFKFFSLEEYADLVVDFLERLSPHIRIERLAGEVPPRFLGGPALGLRSERVAEFIVERMRRRGTWQGRLYKG